MSPLMTHFRKVLAEFDPKSKSPIGIMISRELKNKLFVEGTCLQSPYGIPIAVDPDLSGIVGVEYYDKSEWDNRLTTIQNDEKDQKVAVLKYMIKTTPRDYTELFHLENGCYQGTCLSCKEIFHGPKREVICKVCRKG